MAIHRLFVELVNVVLVLFCEASDCTLIPHSYVGIPTLIAGVIRMLVASTTLTSSIGSCKQRDVYEEMIFLKFGIRGSDDFIEPGLSTLSFRALLPRPPP